QPDGLIASQAGGFVDKSVGLSGVIEILFGPGYEKGQALWKTI
ncbi:unnamed protein product, partial [marine sediment metagenome]